MDTYEIRIDFTDGTFAVVKIAGESIADAMGRATRGLWNVARTTLLCTVAAAPATPLVVFA